MTELKIKEITGFNEDGKDKTKVIFADSDKETEIIFEGSGKIKIAVGA
ncbi:MAG: hypothetical protein VZR09_07030 [Candidatus Gastranaerophilaceae bacterium]|jgi:hypothetical protein|nr:hypothetical protein [Candidatus Gastranaerophilaceae bacterium]